MTPIDLTRMAEAKAALLAAFDAYQRWQNGDGDRMTFADWVVDEIPDPPPAPSLSSSSAEDAAGVAERPVAEVIDRMEKLAAVHRNEAKTFALSDRHESERKALDRALICDAAVTALRSSSAAVAEAVRVAVAREREACAKVCDEIERALTAAKNIPDDISAGMNVAGSVGAFECARIIRARR